MGFWLKYKVDKTLGDNIWKVMSHESAGCCLSFNFSWLGHEHSDHRQFGSLPHNQAIYNKNK